MENALWDINIKMKYVEPSLWDELQYLEEEVNDELAGVESSFTTQRKVYRFLIEDYEKVNSSLQEDLFICQNSVKTYQERIDQRLTEVTKELSDVNQENAQLHELVIFFGKQLHNFDFSFN